MSTNPTAITMLNLRELIQRLDDGCHKGCDYDEAEGGLVNHCTACCTWITTRVCDLMQVPGVRGAVKRWADWGPLAPAPDPTLEQFREFIKVYGRPSAQALLVHFGAANYSAIKDRNAFRLEMQRRTVWTANAPPLED